MGVTLKLNRTPIRLDGEIVAERVKVAIENHFEGAVKGINQVMREGAKEIELLAKDYAPYAPPELGGSEDPRRHLQEAIETKEEPKPGRRIALTVFVNGRRGGRVLGNGRVVSIGTYAWLMHEGLSPFGSGAYSAREGTLSKSPQAGGKFLERAYRDQRRMIINNAAEAARRAFR
jgi:hypothetical protein